MSQREREDEGRGEWRSCVSHLLHQSPEEDGFLAERVVHQALGEEDHALREVVLGQPGHHPLLLHVRPPRDVDDQVAPVLPVPGWPHT